MRRVPGVSRVLRSSVSGASPSVVMPTDAAGARCGCRNEPPADALPHQLETRHRVGRAVAGAAFVALARVCWTPRLSRPLAILAGWFALSHVVAAITAYDGCPELGAIPSLVRGEVVTTRCGPWQMLDHFIDRSISR